MITAREFNVRNLDKPVHLYRIGNHKGEYVELLDYGATIHSICVADRDGRIDDIVLGAPEGSDLKQCSVMGSVIGRCANRIANGRFEADGTVYQLEQNENGNFLHGASGNYARKMFSASVHEDTDTVTFSLEDRGEGGFDCVVRVQVSYSFGDDSVLTMTTSMVPDGTTVLNPTNHAYFNLGASDVRDLHLMLRAPARVSRDAGGLPDGGKIAVQNTSADFMEGRIIRDAMEDDQTGYFSDGEPKYDEFYILEHDLQQPAAELYCPQNGRIMQIVTDMPSMVLFVFPRQHTQGKNGTDYLGYCAVCLEPGFVPNAVNCPEYDSPLFRKGEQLKTVTKYMFKTDR